MDDDVRRLNALANTRRLLVLLSLKENETPMSIDALATDVAMKETDFPNEDLSDRHIDSVLISLHHAHLPKLESEGLVAFSDGETRVALADDLGDAENILDAVFEGKET
ncbi:DUF7344 domain-containing protein [Halopelagius longus]|uniref:Permease n=1 Tax=Halopelagius longus TaxID=1236180 RepID=A0A1H1D9W8_9EURY|nr:hypothetical protein [Halopelagius longus]RDI71244.1 permease [Halopelagius longus]SDQ73355.1 hypothetical protein SAMN05216278_2309 [Halopelagius longus]